MTILIAAMVFGDIFAASGDGTGIGSHKYQGHDQSRQQKAGKELESSSAPVAHPEQAYGSQKVQHRKQPIERRYALHHCSGHRRRRCGGG